MSGPVDVLARLSNWATREALLGGNFDKAHAIDDVRSAVAELIEADAEFDKANAAYNPLFAKGNKAHTYHDFIAAKKRREVALARVQGGAA